MRRPANPDLAACPYASVILPSIRKMDVQKPVIVVGFAPVQIWLSEANNEKTVLRPYCNRVVCWLCQH